MIMGHDERGKWWVSPSNYDAEVTKDFHFAKNIEFLDTTLRDGEQQAGIVLNMKDKIKIAQKLDEMGARPPAPKTRRPSRKSRP